MIATHCFKYKLLSKNSQLIVYNEEISKNIFSYTTQSTACQPIKNNGFMGLFQIIQFVASIPEGRPKNSAKK
jgi:hypothetical protein